MMTRYSRRWRHLAWGLVLGLVSVSASAGRPTRLNPGKLSDKARQTASRKGNAKMNVLVRFRRSPGAAEKTLIQGLGGGVRKQLSASSRWMSVSLPASVVARLSEHALVDFVASDEPVAPSMDVAKQAANEAPVSAPESAFTGAGVTIAMVDTGVALHPDIQTLMAAVDIVNPPLPADGASLAGGDGTQLYDPANSIDPNGHGTHVAGILVGTGSHSPDGRLAGLAPQANLVSVRVLDGTGHGLSSDVLAGLQWILDNKTQYGIRIVNVSLGHPAYESAAVDPLVQAVDALWDAGVVVVCSAGNGGRDGYVTISSPCNSRKVITVGATNDQRTPEVSDDTTTTYSSRGPTAIDLVAKPDLVAPGNRIVSLRAAGSYQDTLFPERRVAADPSAPEVVEYFEMSGTSMASPIVAGTAALMLEQDPSLNPGTIKARLMLSARKPAVGDPLVTGAGSLDILAALRANGTVADAPSPLAIIDVATGLIGFENTAVLWGNESFSLMTLWPGSMIWTDPTAYYQSVVWTAGEIWPSAELWPSSEIWPTGENWPQDELWPESLLWPDSPAWSRVRNTLDGLPIEIAPLSLGFQDP
jgi:serine protease AprX